MSSEQSSELFWSHADDVQNAPQRSLWHVSTWVNWHRHGSSVGMLHHMVAADYSLDSEASALERLDYLRSRYSRDSARHKAASYQNSGDVACKRQLVGWFDHIEQRIQCGTQVGDRLFLGSSVANRANTRTEHSGGAPDAVLVLLDRVGHVNDLGHAIQYRTFMTLLYAPARRMSGASPRDVLADAADARVFGGARVRSLRCAQLSRRIYSPDSSVSSPSAAGSALPTAMRSVRVVPLGL